MGEIYQIESEIASLNWDNPQRLLTQDEKEEIQEIANDMKHLLDRLSAIDRTWCGREYDSRQCQMDWIRGTNKSSEPDKPKLVGRSDPPGPMGMSGMGPLGGICSRMRAKLDSIGKLLRNESSNDECREMITIISGLDIERYNKAHTEDTRLFHPGDKVRFKDTYYKEELHGEVGVVYSVRDEYYIEVDNTIYRARIYDLAPFTEGWKKD